MIPIPVGDAPNYTNRRPWVNWTLIGLNVTVFVWTAFYRRGQGPILEWGHVPLAPRPATWLSHMFLHDGAMHLGGNMLFLWIFGDNVEGRLGTLGYLCGYLAFGLAAVLLFTFLEPQGAIPLVGASGAIFGVLGYYFVAFPANRVRLLFWFFVVTVFWMPARLLLALYVVLDLVRLLAQGGHDPLQPVAGVAYAAHVGGFACGALLALFLEPLLPRLRPLAARRTATLPSALLLAQAHAALERGDPERAESLLTLLWERAPDSIEGGEAGLNLAILAHQRGQEDQAERILRTLATQHPQPSLRAEAHSLLDRLADLR